MSKLLVIDGPRKGDYVNCCSKAVCECNYWGHCLFPRTIRDGYTETLIYRREGDHWIPHRVNRETCILKDYCPSCDRPMPPKTAFCLNCGTDMDPLGWNEEIEDV